MFVHNINPVLVSLGPFEIRYYGLVFVIGFLLAYYFLNKKREELGIEKKDVENFLLYLILGTIIGARLFHIFLWEPGYYLSNPSQLLAVWRGGLSLHGGLVGVIAVTYYFSKKHKIKLMKLADVLTLPALFGLALGRFANFMIGVIVGIVTIVRWCVEFPNYSGCRHPVQLYGAIGRFLLFGYLLDVMKHKKFKDGFIFWMFIFFMGIGRFVVDFLREDPRVLGLSMGQYLSLIMALVGGYVLWKYYRKEK